ncbi:HDOD domain-containing protein [Stenotrophomonas sp.]|uniref:HDOD domain-containing protein n=1 Tax=Stenotrophomonas sp. TaxID=69392 RepID=UPI002897B71A|nr:HDOD domain-containing protein [Stenotrophomonas sp.]
MNGAAVIGMVILSSLAAAVLVGALAWWWQRQPRPHAPARSRNLAASDDVGATTTVAAAPTAGVLQRRFLLLALGVGPDDADNLRVQRAVVEDVVAALTRADLSSRYTPRRPNLLPQLIQSVNDSAASSRSIARIIGSDAVLAATLLRIANSALYRLQGQDVQSIERAVTLIGNDGIRQIISAALVQPVMESNNGADARFSSVLWEYTLRLSLAAADHARSVEREDGFAAQLAGLLLGLGAALTMQACADVLARPPLRVREPGTLLELLERCSAPTAVRIAQHWKLAPSIVQALQQVGEQAPGGLARSLQVGQLAASAAMLHAPGQLSEDEAIAALSAQLPGHVAAWLWKRVSQYDGERA